MKLLFYLFFSLPCILLSQSNWQQNADYKINIDIDVESFQFNGTQEKYKANSDFIFTNYIFNDNPLNNKKFQIPKNYQSYFQLIIDGIVVNEIFVK